MSYQLHHEGQDLGVFSLPELHRRRQAGELSGAYVWREGMSEWQSLDAVLAAEGMAIASGPVSSPSHQPKARVVLIGSIAAMLVASAVALVLMIPSLRSDRESAKEDTSPTLPAKTDPIERPIRVSTNAMTYKDAHERSRQFRVRQWIEGYKERSARGGSCDQQSLHALETWLIQTYGGSTNSETESAAVLFDRLVANPDCEDPMVLTIAALETVDPAEKVRRLERALARFQKSKHRAYPKFFAAVTLAGADFYPRDQAGQYISAALQHWGVSLRDGSYQPEDEAELADIFIKGWAYNFFSRVAPPILAMVKTSRSAHFKWLGLMLEGEHHVNQAWRARGSGFVDSVTPQGWEGFRTNLLVARQSFSNAWQMRPDRPMAAARMVYVAMSDADAAEMRVWFDRARAAQVDHPEAWASMRFGLRPRWHGTLETMLELGKTAVETERFDTDVPRMYFDVVSDLESELKMPRGKHIYGRPNIWPHFRRMYEGYIAEPTEVSRRAGWRTTYAVVASFAGKYDIAREQLAAVNWQASPWSLRNWGADVSLLVPEVAARTGPLGPRIAEAEAKRLEGDVTASLASYKALQSATEADERTASFIRCRVAGLQLESGMNTRDWISFLPSTQNDEAWQVAAGKMLRSADGAVEVEADESGYLLFSRARTGADFELKGEVETISANRGVFETGLMIGVPEINGTHAVTLRIRRSLSGGEVIFAQGETRPGTTTSVPLNADRNSFHLRYRKGLATLSVNDKEVFREARSGQIDWKFGEDVLVGLGTSYALRDATLRFRNVQFRKLTD